MGVMNQRQKDGRFEPLHMHKTSKCSGVSFVIPCILHNQSINTPISPVCESREFSDGDTNLEAIADAKLLLGTGILDEGMDHAGSGVAGINEAADLNLDVVIVQAVYVVEAAVLDEPGAAELSKAPDAQTCGGGGDPGGDSVNLLYLFFFVAHQPCLIKCSLSSQK
ncbi:hypothetical protein Tco_0894785 [Tanacetum coccineum]|uniref:Uncharacterized protein n=1 Tax=Tanacetum coccineum TaxID=301880 RepID=A0ABQ5CDZ1_9ASTR